MNDVNKFYDFVIDEVGSPIIRTFEAGIVRDSERGTRLVQTSDFVNGYASDTEEAVNALRHNGYFSWEETIREPMNVRVKSPFMKVKLGILENGNVLLNKVYDNKAIVDGMSSIASYIHYINSGTGKQYMMLIATDLFSSAKEQSLREDGLVNIDDTVLKEFISELSYDSYVPVEVKVKPPVRE